MPKTTILTSEEVHTFLAGIGSSTLLELRNRALIGLMAATGCSAQAVVQLKLGHLLPQDGWLWLRLHDGDRNDGPLPCPATLQDWLQSYLERAELRDPDELVFRRVNVYADALLQRPMTQREVFTMVGERAEATGIRARLAWRAFRATGLSAYLGNGHWLAPP
jgi:site-specific recombinase XerD